MTYWDCKEKVLTKDRNRDPSARWLFLGVAFWEERFGKDLALFDEAELDEFLRDISGTKEFPMTRALDVVANYVSRCRYYKLPYAESYKAIRPDLQDEMRATMFASPLHLAAEMDRLFSPVEEDRPDLMLRCFLWLSFAEMDSRIIINLRKSDADLSARKVRSSDGEFRIFEEALPVFERLLILDSFRVGTPTNDGFAPQAHPEYLFSSYRRRHNEVFDGENRLGSVRTRLSTVAMETGASLSYGSVRMSGMFYRVFERERAGLTATPGDELDPFDQRGAEVRGGPPRARAYRDRRTRKELLLKYQAWKAAFAV